MRDVTPQDFDTVYDIYMGKHVNPFMSYEVMDKNAFQAVFDELNARDYFWIFEDDTGPYGMCSVNREIGRASNSGYLGSLAVTSDRQRMGLGHQIIYKVEDFLRANGFVTLFLFAENDNEHAISFYKQLGYAETGRIPKYFKREGEDFFVDELLFTKVL